MEIMLPQNLITLRKLEGYSQTKAASLLGLKRPTYVNYEKGGNEPGNATLLAMARLYGVTVDSLLTENLSDGNLNKKQERQVFEQKGNLNGNLTGNLIEEKAPVSEKAEVLEKLRKIEADVKENFGKAGPYNVYDFDGHAAAGQAIALLEDDKKRGEPNMYLPGLGPGLHIRISAAGESMFPSIKPGDKPVATWVSKLSEVHPGGVYIVIDANDGAVCKRLYREGKTHFRLESDNEMFQPYKRHLEDVLAVFRVREVHSTDLRPYMLDVRRDIRVLQTQMEEMQVFLHQK